MKGLFILSDGSWKCAVSIVQWLDSLNNRLMPFNMFHAKEALVAFRKGGFTETDRIDLSLLIDIVKELS